MALIQAIVLGLIQGLTEFLPISSSGHLFLIPDLLGWKDMGAGFTAVIQLGTILAVLIFFREDLGRTLRTWFRSFSDKSLKDAPETKLGWAVALGTVPVVLAGLALEKKIDSDFRSAYVIAGTLIFFALVLWAAEKVGKQDRGMENITVKDGLLMGLWQCLALVPGSSRSGCTISGGLFSGLDRATAARFSFLLSIPAIVLSGVYKLIKERHDLMGSGLMPTLVATVIAFITGYWSIAFLMKFLQTKTTGVFVVYRIVLGVIILGLVMSGRIHNKPEAAAVSMQHHGIPQAAHRA